MLIRLLLVLCVAVGMAPHRAYRLDHPDTDSVSRVIKPPAREDFTIEFFPAAPHLVGDQLSLRVTYRGQEALGGQEITLAEADRPGEVLETARFSSHSQQAVFYWFMDTKDHPPGFVTFQLELPEMGLSWETGVNLLPHPGGEPHTWTEVHTSCCTVHMITGTDAEEDILKIQEILETQTNEALAQFESQIGPDDTALDEPLTLALIPSVIGQGGFATDIAVITYSDRNWAGADFSNIIHHEIVHVLDRQLNDGPRPTLFAEGLAVYFAGGHYQDGDPLQRAAALLAMDRYIPMTDFVNDFYAAQHEISYLEAGGLVAYLSETWGVEAFLDFYFHLPEASSDAESIDAALQAQYGMTLRELEGDYINHLASINPDPAVEDNVRLTIETYKTMRRYQQIRVPSAYFRSAWWPPIDQAIERDIADDYARRAKAPVEVILENLFLALYPAIDSGEVQRAEEILEAIQRLLGLAEEQGNAFSHYSIGWPLPHPARLSPGY